MQALSTRSSFGMHGGKIIGKIVIHALSLLVAFFFFMPFFIMVTTSLKLDREVYIYPIRILPEKFYLGAYAGVFDIIPFFRYFGNTLTICAFNVIGVVITSPLVAYSLARLRWKGRDLLFFITLSVMMIPYQSIMVPIFIIFRRLNLVGTFLPLIIPQWFGVPFFIFLVRQFFKGLPKDLEDAARIDGCGEFGIYWRIVLPLCRPAILTILIMQLLNSWNDFTGPLIYLQNQSMYTLSIGLQQFKMQYSSNWTQMTAAATMMSLPIIVLFFFIQRQFMEGMTFSGIKD